MKSFVPSLSILKSRTLRNGVLLFFSRGINTFTGLISSVLYGVVFSKYEISVVTLFEMLVQLIFSAGFSWSSVGLIRFGREEYDVTGRINRTSSVRSHMFGLLFILFVVGVLLFDNQIMAYIGVTNYLVIPLLIVNAAFWIINEHLSKLFMTVERHYVNVIHDVGISVIKLLIFLLFYFKILAVSVIMYLFLSTISLIVFFFMYLYFLRKEYVFPFFVKISRQEYLQFFRFVWPQFLGFGGIYFINWIDIWVIRAFCSFEELGAYNYMYSLFMKVAVISFLLNTLFFPKIMTWKKNVKKIHEYLKYIPLGVFGLMMLFAVGMNLIFPYFFNMLFGDKFVVAYPAFAVLLFAIPFYYVTYTLVPVINSYDRVLELQFVNILVAVVNLVIDLVLIRHIGIIGGAIGTLVSFAFKLIACVLITRMIFNQHIRREPVADATSQP